MDALTSIHGRRLGLGPNDELLIAGKTILLDNNGVPTPIAQVGSAKIIAAGATKALTYLDAGKIIKLDTLTGSVVTLPAATGSGVKYKFYVSVLATSNSHKIQVASANDFMIGLINGSRIDVGNAVQGFAAANSGVVATNSDTITLNRTTTGSVTVGEWIEVEDVAAATWQVNGLLSATGAAFATPFTAAV